MIPLHTLDIDGTTGLGSGPRKPHLNSTMTDTPTTDSTPAWFTPPEDGAPAPPRRAPMQAPPSPPPAPDGVHITAPPPAPADGFHLTAPAPLPAAPAAPAHEFFVTKPGGTFAFTPPNTAPVGAAAPAPAPAPAASTPASAAAPAPTAAPGAEFRVTGLSDMFTVTPPDTAARPTGNSVDFWPVGSLKEEPAPEPAGEESPTHRAPLSPLTSGPAPGATALAPPAPLVRPIITITPASSPTLGVEVVEPRRREPEPEDDGGRGWRVRSRHSASSVPEPPKPTGILLDPQLAAEQAAFVMPRMSWEKTESHRPARRYLLFGAGLLALSGLAALTLTTVGGFAHGIHQPQTIGGLAQVDTPSVQTTLDSLDSYERSAGATNVVTGAYGTQDQTQVLLVVVQSSTLANGGTPAALQTFVHGIVTGASSVGWTLDPSKITTTTVDGATFECDEGPASANGGAILSMCAWTDPGTAGAVVDITGSSLTDVLNETVQARAGSER